MLNTSLIQNLEEVLARQIIALQGSEGTPEEQKLDIEKANSIAELAKASIQIQTLKLKEVHLLHKQGYVLDANVAKSLGYMKPQNQLPATTTDEKM